MGLVFPIQLAVGSVSTLDASAAFRRNWLHTSCFSGALAASLRSNRRSTTATDAPHRRGAIQPRAVVEWLGISRLQRCADGSCDPGLETTLQPESLARVKSLHGFGVESHAPRAIGHRGSVVMPTAVETMACHCNGICTAVGGISSLGSVEFGLVDP